MRLTREGLEGAREILALSSHSAGTIAEDFPDLSDRTRALPGGVDTDLFRPDALDPTVLDDLVGGPGRGPEQTAVLVTALDRAEDAEDLARSLRGISASYDPRAHDADAGGRISAFQADEAPLIVYVGKLIHSKGVHSLISAFARVRRQTGARLLIVGFGTFREGLEALTYALGTGDTTNAERLAASGRLLEGGPDEPLEHFELSASLLHESSGMEEDVAFTGPLKHAELAQVLPAADVAVVPSIFPETFGLVAAEFAASGVVPFVADHSGLREAGAIVGRGLPFDLRVRMDGLEENLAFALGRFLSMPQEERVEHSRTVRRNSVEALGWNTLAESIVELLA
jgi:glycosyltransferase involved in cell wall biosynthesis